MTPETQGYFDAITGNPSRPPTLGAKEYESGYKKGLAAKKKINPFGQKTFKQEKS